MPKFSDYVDIFCLENPEYTFNETSPSSQNLSKSAGDFKVSIGDFFRRQPYSRFTNSNNYKLEICFS